MERWFRMEDKSLCDIVDHTREQLGSKDGLKVYVASDSQVKKKDIYMATVIVYRYGTNGAHYVYHLETIPRKKMTIYERLFDEGSRTINTAMLLKENIPSLSIEALEFDYNGVKKTVSTPLISVMRGWALGLGFNPVFKGGQMLANKAGDHVCRKKEKEDQKINLVYS